MSLISCIHIRSAVAFVLLLSATTPVWAGDNAKVFPVDAFFYDASPQSTLDTNFRAEIDTIGLSALKKHIHESLTKAFNGKVGPMDENTANRTFAVSFNVPRATSYSVNKGNGDSDLVAAVTASLYFTNILTGEILTTISRTVVSRAVIANSAPMDDEKKKLFAQALNTLIDELAADAGRDFNPVLVNAQITDQVGNLLVLDAGYSKGIQTGDQLEDSSSNLIQVVYAADSYSFAQRVIAPNVGKGVVFHKYLSHVSDGKLKPRTIVLVEAQPKGFTKEYIAQLFSEILGDKAPLSIIQVDHDFSNLLNVVVQSNQLSNSSIAKRKPPTLFIRLRVAEPIVYETHTNLYYQTVRHYESLAFADIVDSNGRVNASAIGKDVISDNITNNIGPGIPERREVNIKNALIDLAEKLGNLSEPRREQVDVVPSTSADDAYIKTNGKFFPPKQKGVVLRKVRADIGKGPQQIWAPTTEAYVESGSDTNMVGLSLGLPLSDPQEQIKVGNVFEIEQLGITPRSSNSFVECGPAESLGTVVTPSLLDLAENALSNKMPGILYAPSIKDSADQLISPINNFESNVNWEIPPISFCIQPVDLITTGEDKCTDHCERPITAKYGLRVKSGNEVVSRITFEGQFTSTDFYKTTPTDQITRLINSNLIDEAMPLLDKDADAINFNAQK